MPTNPDTSALFADTAGVSLGSSVFAFDAKTPFSVECWHSPTQLTDYQPLIGKHDGKDKSGWVLAVQTTYGYVFFRENGVTGSGNETKFVPAVGTIHHVVGTYDGSTQRIYVDGTERGPATTDSISVPTNGYPVRFGDHVRGRVDEVALYDRALPAATILAHYDAGK